MISSTRASASHNCLNNRLLLRPHFSHFFVPLFCWRPPWGVRDRFSPVFGNCRIRGDHCCYGFSFRLNGFPQNHPISLERILIQCLIHFSPTPSPQEALSDPVSLRQLRKNWPRNMYCLYPLSMWIVSYPLSRHWCAFTSQCLIFQPQNVTPRDDLQPTRVQ